MAKKPGPIGQKRIAELESILDAYEDRFAKPSLVKDPIEPFKYYRAVKTGHPLSLYELSLMIKDADKSNKASEAIASAIRMEDTEKLKQYEGRVLEILNTQGDL